MNNTFIQPSLIDSLIIHSKQHLEQRLRESIEKRIGHVYDVRVLKGRVSCVSGPVMDSYFIDGELLFHYLHTDYSVEEMC